MKTVLDLTTVEELAALDPDDYSTRLGHEEVTHILGLTDCIWMHSGDPAQPHAKLTSGKHSNGFINVLAALSYTPLCTLFGRQLAELIKEQDPTLTGSKVWVVGSDHAGAALSHAVATALGARHDFTAKDGNDQKWSRLVIAQDERVIQVEELITTLKTTKAVHQGIRVGNGSPVQFAPFVVTLVHRSPEVSFEGGPILFLAHYNIDTWEAADCPLCQAGSAAIEPKSPPKNWLRLTGRLTP